LLSLPRRSLGEGGRQIDNSSSMLFFNSFSTADYADLTDGGSIWKKLMVFCFLIRVHPRNPRLNNRLWTSMQSFGNRATRAQFRNSAVSAANRFYRRCLLSLPAVVGGKPIILLAQLCAGRDITLPKPSWSRFSLVS
jgi:hypothetical protein